MAASFVEIANSALVKIGASTIIALTDTSKEAKLCNLRMTPILRSVLRVHPWNCAIKRVILAPSVTTPAFGFSSQAPLPSDCIRVLKVGPEGVEYRIEGRNILCDETSVYLKYIKLVEDPTELDDLLSEAIAARLAADICYALSQSENLQNNMWTMYKDLLRKAKSTDGKEDPAIEVEADLWLEARLGADSGNVGSLTSADA